MLKVMSQSLNNWLHGEIPLGNIPNQPLTSICTKRHDLWQALYALSHRGVSSQPSIADTSELPSLLNVWTAPSTAFGPAV